MKIRFLICIISSLFSFMAEAAAFESGAGDPKLTGKSVGGLVGLLTSTERTSVGWSEYSVERGGSNVGSIGGSLTQKGGVESSESTLVAPFARLLEPTTWNFKVGDIEFQAVKLPATADLREELEGYTAVLDPFYAPEALRALFGDEGVKTLGGPEEAKKTLKAGIVKREMEVLGKLGITHIRLQTLDKILVGYLSMENWGVYTGWDKNLDNPTSIPTPSIYVREFYIEPAFQKRGIATVVIPALPMILTPGARFIYLTTRSMNEKAKRLYEHLGFKQREVLQSKATSLMGISSGEYVSYELHL